MYSGIYYHCIYNVSFNISAMHPAENTCMNNIPRTVEDEHEEELHVDVDDDEQLSAIRLKSHQQYYDTGKKIKL